MNEAVENVEGAMALIGSRWRPAIMYALIEMGTQRFSELRRLIPGVSQRMLTKQLRELERAGLVHRAFFESVPPRVEYSVTELGRTLRPVYVAICDWSSTHGPTIADHQVAYDRVHRPSGEQA